MRIRSRREEGQVYPALLLAVIGGFAIAVSFIPLQNLLDQTGRADTAADSAALAAADAYRDDFLELHQTTPESPELAGRIVRFLGFLGIAGYSSQEKARELAEANGADVEGVVLRQPFNPQRMRATFTVITKQNDEVKGGDATAKSKSRATAVAHVTWGLCLNPDLGVQTESAGCVGALQWVAECVELPNKPPPPPYCIEPMPDLEWDIYLIKNDSPF